MDQQKFLSKIEKKLEPYFTVNAPIQIPTGGRKLLVKVIPWMVLFTTILALPWLFLAITVGSSIGFIGSVSGATLKPLYYVSALALGAQVVLMGLALPGLFNQKYRGWKLLFYAGLVNVTYTLFRWLSVPAAFFGLVWSLLISVLVFYILFQIRGYYHKD